MVPRYGNMQDLTQRTNEPLRYFPLSDVVGTEVSEFPFLDLLNDGSSQTEEKPPMTFLIVYLLGLAVEYDYLLRIWALDVT